MILSELIYLHQKTVLVNKLFFFDRIGLNHHVIESKRFWCLKSLNNFDEN